MPEQPSVDFWALTDLCTPWCIHVAATLRVADHLAAGIGELDALAAAAECDAYFLGAVLRHLTGKGLFTEPEPNRFALDDPARVLLDPGVRLGLNLDSLGGRMAHAWGTLLETVRSGQPAYAARFGRPFWEDLDAHPEIAADFDALIGPGGHGTPDPDILLDGDWDAIQTVVDVGGGTGALLAEVLKAYPHTRGTLVDLPRTVAGAAEIFAAAGVSDRVTTLGQSFFDPLPAGADLYILKSILNDWPDPEATAILRRCAEAVSPSGRVVVLGGVIPGPTAGPITIEIVLLGGKHRPLADFRPLAEAAGLTIHAAGTLPSGRFAVDCRLP